MYNKLSELYDLYMEEVPYQKWFNNIQHYLKKYNKSPKTVLDLGCGTGTITLMLKKAGFSITGMDISPEMLAIAANKALEQNESIVFTCQDMREFELPAPVDLIISLCDCINYITVSTDILKVFKNCYKYLNKGGMLIFDVNSVYKLKEVLGFSSFCQTTPASAFTCENYFDDETNINEYYVNIFTKQSNGTYERFEEYHYEKAYTTKEITTLLSKAGFTLYQIADADTLAEPTASTERIYFIAGKD